MKMNETVEIILSLSAIIKASIFAVIAEIVLIASYKMLLKNPDMLLPFIFISYFVILVITHRLLLILKKPKK